MPLIRKCFVRKKRVGPSQTCPAFGRILWAKVEAAPGEVEVTATMITETGGSDDVVVVVVVVVAVVGVAAATVIILMMTTTRARGTRRGTVSREVEKAGGAGEGEEGEAGGVEAVDVAASLLHIRLPLLVNGLISKGRP